MGRIQSDDTNGGCEGDYVSPNYSVLCITPNLQLLTQMSDVMPNADIVNVGSPVPTDCPTK